MDAYGLLTFPGHVFFHFLSYLGQLAALASELMIALRSGVWRLKLVAQQIVAIGYGSQGVVIVTGAFTGAVFTFQSYAKFKEFGFETTVGAVVSVALCRELGPVLAGLMVAGRVGAAMAADIGTMKVTEQVDALRVMGGTVPDSGTPFRTLMANPINGLVSMTLGSPVAAAYSGRPVQNALQILSSGKRPALATRAAAELEAAAPALSALGITGVNAYRQTKP